MIIHDHFSAMFDHVNSLKVVLLHVDFLVNVFLVECGVCLNVLSPTILFDIVLIIKLLQSYQFFMFMLMKPY
jgi:hypothetical protein